MGRVILGSLLSAILMFAWGFLVWGYIGPEFGPRLGKFDPYRMLPPETSEKVLAALQDVGSGTYMYPGPEEPEAPPPADADKAPADDAPGKAAPELAPTAEAVEGTLILHYSQHKATMDEMTQVMAIGFAHMLFAAFLMACLLRIAAPAIKTFGSRVSFVIAMGLMGTVFILGRDIIWFHQDMGHYLFLGGYYFGAFLLAGLVLGALIRPETA